MTTKMKINRRLKIVLAGLATLGILFTFPFGLLSGLFWGFVIGACIYLGWPIVPFRLLAVQFWNYKVFRMIAPPVAGLLMSQYWAFGASLAVRYLGFGENLLSYHYASSPYLSLAPIAGAASGFLILIGARLNLTVEKILFASGCFVLLMISLYTGFLIIAPE
jgi:hypothetical protein